MEWISHEANVGGASSVESA